LTFLILKISVYLLLALLAGMAAGWVLRHVSASTRDEELQKTLADARARVPQFETLLRSRDNQIARMRETQGERDEQIGALTERVRELEQSLKEKERALQRQRAVSGPATPGSDSKISAEGTGSDGDAGRIAELERQLEEACAQAGDAMAEAAATESELITLKARLERMTDGGGQSLEEMREVAERLNQKTIDYERLKNELEQERRRVAELERERELQNKSLQVLHQQLELERERERS
jgi:chromosome segregation ATPase